ncbi:hypothetical protein ACFXPX_38235 [Kitasatospora sp. NPDC059146]|uniref:hypothetical protein n=1 Tax=Kitasatospora sp. NPDC059146 TaxID=3346741 RepID=UPI00369CF0CF
MSEQEQGQAQEPGREQGQDRARGGTPAPPSPSPSLPPSPSTPPTTTPPASTTSTSAKARLVFRDPLDQQSRDDTDAGWGDRPGAGAGGGRGLDWYLSQRPPHHGD